MFYRWFRQRERKWQKLIKKKKEKFDPTISINLRLFATDPLYRTKSISVFMDWMRFDNNVSSGW